MRTAGEVLDHSPTMLRSAKLVVVLVAVAERVGGATSAWAGVPR
jgi:hypothetical protein